MEDTPPDRPIPRSRLSKTPSWITLGFILGALFVWSLPREPKKAPPTLGAAAPPTTVRLERPRLTEIEAVFAEWGEYAIWENDVTEVALWDAEKRSYTICYEVLRRDDTFYFRSIPRLTRPIFTRGVAPESPLQLTETERTRREWIEHGQFEPRSQPARRGSRDQGQEP